MIDLSATPFFLRGSRDTPRGRSSKGYRREDAKEKKATMDTYWAPADNNLGTLGRWAFSELTEIYQIESDFEARVERAFDEMIEQSGRNNRAR